MEKRDDATSDPRWTIFVGWLNYKTSESTLKQVFERYGTVIKVRIVKDLKGKSRGYGFVEFKHKDDAHEAYWRANWTWIDDKMIIVDRESGRVEKDFLPRRLGVGIGKNSRHSDNEEKVIKQIIKKFKDGIKKWDLKAEIKEQVKYTPKEELKLEV